MLLKETNDNAKSSSKPLCYAPFTSFLIDTNKGVRPCCAWQDNYLGNVEQENLEEILEGPAWKLVQKQMMQGEWPKGCMGCKVIELYSGDSVRSMYSGNAKRFLPEGKLALLEIEINSTNQCNLVCMHCSSTFSSLWEKYDQLLIQDGFEMRGANSIPRSRKDDMLIKNISSLDLGFVCIVRFKGGEPFLNKDVKQLLHHLDSLNRLKDLRVEFYTNGTVIDRDYLEIFSRCKEVSIDISVDGTGALQEYIRYGNSSNERIEQFIAAFSPLPNIFFKPLVSVMAYNIFRLTDIAAWWKKIHSLYPDKTLPDADFKSLVLFPKYLSINALSDKTRTALSQKYESLNDPSYRAVIQALKLPWAGLLWHNKFIQFTRLMDKYRGLNIADIVPELKEELVEQGNDAGIDLNDLVREIDFLIDNGCGTANLYMKRAFLRREQGNTSGSLADFRKAFELDVTLSESVPAHWFG